VVAENKKKGGEGKREGEGKKIFCREGVKSLWWQTQAMQGEVSIHNGLKNKRKGQTVSNQPHPPTPEGSSDQLYIYIYIYICASQRYKHNFIEDMWSQVCLTGDEKHGLKQERSIKYHM
jgi:hypothetical protein